MKIHSQIHIGVAAGTGGGLVVPVIHQADQKDLAQIAAEVKRYQKQLDGLRFAPPRTRRRHIHPQQPGYVRRGPL